MPQENLNFMVHNQVDKEDGTPFLLARFCSEVLAKEFAQERSTAHPHINYTVSTLTCLQKFRNGEVVK